MEFQVGQIFSISFTIGDDYIMSTAHFTGDTLKVGGDTIFICKLASGKEYGFTQAKLASFLPLNDPSKRDHADSITM